jgi:hypothetical protein
MSKYIKDENSSKLPAFVCIADAKAKNEKNIVLWSDKQVVDANKFKDLVSNAYFRSRVYLNYREGFIVIKVDRPTVQDRVSKAVETLDSYCVSHGIVKLSTKANILYRIK